MTANPSPRRRGSRGVALLLVLVFVALFACLAVALATTSDFNLVISRNAAEVHQASWRAETGMFQTMQFLGGASITGSSAEEVHRAICSRLLTVFDGSAMVSVSDITADAGGAYAGPIIVPLPTGETGTVNLIIVSSGGTASVPTITVTSLGQYHSARRQASCRLTVTRGAIYRYGILSKSKVTFNNNNYVRGVNDPSEGSIGIAAMTGGSVFDIGSGRVDGTVSIVDENASYHTGGATIAGGIQQPCDPPDWPVVDVSPFRPYATNICPANVSGSVSNLLVRPGTNPTFGNNVTIRGVLYIQPPNVLTFGNNMTLIGCIVAETPTIESPTANQIIFNNNFSSSGVESLPAGAAYDGLRNLKGSFLLAPGFYVEFKNNFGTINGSMIASSFQFKNNVTGTVRGGIVNLGYDSSPSASQFTLKNNATITINLGTANDEHAGVSGGASRIVCIAHSYTED